jgi:hypothetical protein
MPMCQGPTIDVNRLPISAVDYTRMLRGVFRHALGYALASSLAAAAGCGAAAESHAADNERTDTTTESVQT